MTHSILRLVFILFLVIKPLSAAADNTILILGDSLSAAYGLQQEQGWVKLLQDKYNDEQADIALVNASISGETSGGALRRLDALLTQYQPTHVLIELGANDGLRGFPVKKMQANLTSLIQKSQAANAMTALMEIYIPPNYGPRYSKMFTDSFSQISEETNTHLLNFFMLNIADKPELMQNDGLHPNKKAQPLIRDEMYDSIKTWLNKD
ncbi:arylesterase [Pseudoalteromonas sp. 13-15]|jgi:acyl-CoA thioesterase I|uniref:arylesterase n=1 Tax=Pseudoalteromonas TaxID=53246 RepID=UPI00026D1871|nr:MULTISPECIES: arylesterase [Pseudoalteromonas]MBL1385115.1 arylesterase [Colwellia sp.]ATG57801.1 arylesterase [Pseudoalteromonas marina]AUL73125.1 arylesterase [Pseudoalteromonas sp. 13-15]KAF7780916.1 acyl-CoA thioesterase I [Pseudoalteromonas marina]SIN83404.1 acyl-CoA thioesterase-1 [Pseudoalteromonas marina]|tara:strand:+ start:436 stop:1059 length:624 start_codon:yes stop_codon:yes gene_type:complete